MDKALVFGTSDVGPIPAGGRALAGVITAEIYTGVKKINYRGTLAQLVEQGPLKPKVIGSIPIRPTRKIPFLRTRNFSFCS